MSELIFTCTGREHLARQNEFRGPNRQEYYEGDNEIVPCRNINVLIERGLAGTYSVLNLRSTTPIRFRRNLQHIRQDGTDVCVLWFVRQGSIVLSRPGGEVTVQRGECTITRSLQPFAMECQVSQQSVHEVLHVVAPTHILRPHIPDDIEAGTVFSSREGGVRITEQTFDILFKEGASISRAAAENLAQAALATFGETVARLRNHAPYRSVSEKRFEDIVCFVQRNLSKSLSVSLAASGCGISERYLAYVLSSKGTTFKNILWEARIKRAQAYLADQNMNHVSIQRIAYMTGFKSPAHFSRMFKVATGVPPQSFRELNSVSLPRTV